MPLPDEFWAASQELADLMGDGTFICDGCGRWIPCRHCVQEPTCDVTLPGFSGS